MSSVTSTCRDLNELTRAAQFACRLLFQECYKAGIKDIFITETYRSQERQNYLYAQGRTRPGQIVTWTKSSNHKSRLAWDIAVAPPKTLYDIGTLTKVGDIAKKLGIHTAWEPPKGYKLEGEVIIPTTSKLKVQLIVEDKKEDAKVNTWNPSSSAIRQTTEEFIEQAVKDKIVNESHLRDVQNRTIPTDRLLGLYITIQQRRNKFGI